MFTGRRWDPARKATVVTATGGQGEEELLSELFVIFKMLPLFSQGPSPVLHSQLLSKLLFQGSMSAPKGLRKVCHSPWDNGVGGSPCPNHIPLPHMLSLSY